MTGAEKAIAREAYEHGRRVAISEHQKRTASSLEGIQATLEDLSYKFGWISFWLFMMLIVFFIGLER